MTDSHETNHAAEAGSRHADGVRKLYLQFVSIFQRGGCKVILWFLQPMHDDVSDKSSSVCDAVKELKEHVFMEIR